MYIKARPFNRASSILERNLVFTIFLALKFLLTVQIVAGIVAAILEVLYMNKSIWNQTVLGEKTCECVLVCF